MKHSCNYQILSSYEFLKWLDAKEITRSISYIQNFYSILPFYAKFDGKNYSEILRETEIFQRMENGYDEIAQNLTIFPDCKIAICRDINRIPPGMNGTSHLCVRVEYIMNPGYKSYPVSDDLLDYTTWMNTLLCMKFMIKPSSDSIISADPSELVSGISLRLINIEINPT